MSVIQEFKSFALRGNVIDLAVGVVVGGAFGTIVSSLVADIIMPIIGIATGGVNFSQFVFTVGQVSILYGKFLQAVFVFSIVAFSLFVVVKGMNTMKRNEAEKVTPPAEPTPEEKLLMEIRDLLKK